MTEDETRAELIDPKLRESGWEMDDAKVNRNFPITGGRIQTGGRRGQVIYADYILSYKGIKLAVIEAKKADLGYGEGVAQAKEYAAKLQLETTFSTNGKEIYSICMKTGREELIERFPTPEELWNKTFSDQNEWREKFAEIPINDKGGTWKIRFYQEIAIQKTLEAVAQKKQRILLTLATGTGKTSIAFQIAWKLFKSRWNLKRDGSRLPRILFLADRNILANQAFNDFSAFPDDALIRIKPSEIKKKGAVPTNGSIFFTIFQTFMSGKDKDGNPTPYFGDYPTDYFDFIIIDECHRGGANDEGNWRGILEYFEPAVQLGLTATPKRKENVDTYKYFGDPIYIYSLKDGINDGFLTPFKVKRIQTTMDEYIYTSDDYLIEGEIEEGKEYKEKDFNRSIEIREREAKRVKIFMDDCDQNEKAIVFCATQEHASLVRDLINQYKKSKDPNYCVRVTANDGALGEQFLREFQDNEKTIPTILTTSQKLSTGVDARNVRNIVLMRPVNQIIEFKQIVGRGTRMFEGKDFFTIYDFVDAYKRFSDPEWDGEPVEPEPTSKPYVPNDDDGEENISEPAETIEKEKKTKIKVKLNGGKEREINFMISTSFWSADGHPVSATEFMESLFGKLPELFKDEQELRTLWSSPLTRKVLLAKLDESGFSKEDLQMLQKLVNMDNSDLYDVLEYVFNGDFKSKTREERVQIAEETIYAILNENQKEFIAFVLSKYVESGVDELDQEKLPQLLINKYQSLEDAKDILGEVKDISKLFIEFQKYLYKEEVA
jgi:type I restriction enzyme R subunit